MAPSLPNHRGRTLWRMGLNKNMVVLTRYHSNILNCQKRGFSVIGQIRIFHLTKERVLDRVADANETRSSVANKS